ncbi:MAG TPA: hypothetical protein VH374_08935 [Polyangia bacterium]|nr:hypothetical protein [Polyangia bacterium]
MRNASNRISLCFVLVAVAACSSSPAGNSTGSGGAMGSGGSGSGGTTGGSGGSSAGTGGSATGGVSGGSGGASPATDASMDTPSGSDAMITDGSAGETGAHTPMPSAGCGKPNPNMPKRTIMTGGMTGTYYVNLPANYDINKPMPLGFGFHGFNNQACLPGVSGGGECQGFPQLPAITVYMKSITAGWEGQPQPLGENLQYYHDVLNVMKTEYCVDEARIFIAGVSSGAQFIEHIACLDGDTLWQVTAVSGYIDGASVNANCKGTPPVLVTQGATETGGVDVTTPTMFAKRNGCSATPPAMYMQNLADMKAAFNMGKEDHRCMDWDGCTKNPVRYCISSQMTFGGLTHGWPKVGGMLISDFQNTLPK